jgi:hypothetical protein
MTTLKPCPFCRGDIEPYFDGDTWAYGYRCLKCFMSLFNLDGSILGRADECQHRQEETVSLEALSREEIASLSINTRPSPWRKWPEEKPEDSDENLEYLLYLDDGEVDITIVCSWREDCYRAKPKWDWHGLNLKTKREIKYWMPIPELPEASTPETDEHWLLLPGLPKK